VKKHLACALLAGLVSIELARADFLSPMTSFGGGDGWLAPGDRTYLTTDTTQRGLAFNPKTGHLLIVNRSGSVSVPILDGTTGANLGSVPLSSTVTTPNYGLFPLNMIGVADDGAIYAANLAVTTSAPLRIYRWQNESSAPSMDYASDPTINGGRIGDTLDVRGSGNDTQILMGVSPGVAYRGYLTISTLGGAPYTVSDHEFTTNPPEEADHHLGITFAQGNTVIGTRGGLRNFSDLQPARVSSFGTNPPTLRASPVLTSQGERLMDFAMIGGTPILATVDTLSSVVRVYDFTNPQLPILLDTKTNIAGASNANVNGVGQVRFGSIAGNTATLYALNANNGIQAFNVVVPEPAMAGVLGFAALAARLRGRKA
jgi:hypothetical protein